MMIENQNGDIIVDGVNQGQDEYQVTYDNITYVINSDGVNLTITNPPPLSGNTGGTNNSGGSN